MPRNATSVQRMQTRWQELFADLEAQARADEALDLAAEVADRTRGELARVSLVSRLRSRVGGPVSLQVSGAGSVAGTLVRVGADWLLVLAPDETIVPLDAVGAAVNLPLEAVPASGVGPVASRLRLGSVVRAMARDRSVLAVMLRDGTAVVGTPDRVGADFFDLAVHGRDQAPRRTQVRSRWAVAFGAVATLSRSGDGR